MAATDNILNDFYDRMASLSIGITHIEGWIRDYENKRKHYPDWVTREGVSIKLQDISDSHLENLIPFMKKKDPTNGWLQAFEYEKRYRKLVKKLNLMKLEYKEMGHISDMCL